MSFYAAFRTMTRLRPAHIMGSQNAVNFNLGNQRWMSALASQFEAAKERLGTFKEDPGNEAKLKIYALFKQSTVGPVTTKRPGMMDFVGRAKWDAWNNLGQMEKDDAKKNYIDFITSLAGEEEEAAEVAPGEAPQYTCLDVSCTDGLRIIKLNRPKRKNAITSQMYEEWITALEEAAADKNTVITVLTGAGDYYCSGNDLSNFANIPSGGLQEMAENGKHLLLRFISAFINFPKPLIGVVNGPAVGVAVSTLALFDAVYCTDKATFHAPFTALGQSSEGCSSYTFPRLLGPSLATEMLYFNKKITAQEAKHAGLVAEVYPDSTFQQEIWPKLQAHAKLPAKSLIYSKELVRGHQRETLHKVNLAECERLQERWLSDDCMKAVMSFMEKK